MRRIARRGLAALAAITMLAATACDLGDARPRVPVRADAVRAGLSIGIAVNLREGSLEYRRSIARMARRAGVHTVRDELRWDTIERRPGVYDWREPDAIFTLAAEQGLRVLPLLDKAPGWATGRRRGSYDIMPRDPATFAAFAARAVARYGAGGRFWRERPHLKGWLAPTWFELFNEPYGLAPHEGGPEIAAYARTVAAGVAAARLQRTGARFLIAAELTATGPGGEVPWLDGLYDAVPGFGAFFDGIAVHPYAGPQAPARYTPGRGDRYQTRRIERLREILVRRGDGAKPVWITEIGWSTCPASPACVSERRQALHLAQLFRLASRSWPWVSGVVVYSMADHGAPRTDKEGWFGLVRDGRAKPAWSVVQQVTRAPLRAP